MTSEHSETLPKCIDHEDSEQLSKVVDCKEMNIDSSEAENQNLTEENRVTPQN